MVIRARARSFPRAALIAATLVLPMTMASGQQTGTPPASPPAQGAGRSGRPPAPPETSRATATGPAADVFAAETRLDEAIIKGDAAAVDGMLAKDAVFVLDDRWTTDGKSPSVSRAAFLKDVAGRPYLVHDLDSEKIEMHAGVGITYGRHVEMRRDATAGGAHLNSTWFQRVFAERNGQWQLLSDRVIHGPTPAPAGVDPTRSDDTPNYGMGPVWFLTEPAPPPPAPQSADEKEIVQLDQKIATAVVNGETDYVRSMTTPDFSMVHGDLWTRGGKAALRDTQDSMLSRVTGKSYGVLDFDHIRAEMHGDIAVTTGRYLARSNGANVNAERAWFSVWFERVYAKHNGQWVYLSHRTVHGPVYGPDRQTVSTK